MSRFKLLNNALAMVMGTLLPVSVAIANLQGESSIPIQESLLSVTFKNNKTLNLDVGIGSGAFHASTDANNEIYTITDRGPNIGCDETENILGTKEFCLKDGVLDTSSKVFPDPSFAPTIYKIRLNADSASGTYSILEKIPLRDKDGKAITGLPNPFTSTDTESAYNANAELLKFDANGLDTEALVRLKDGTFWVGEEYGPSLVHIAADGKIINRVVPAGEEGDLSSANYKVSGLLPSILKKRKLNRGIESIAVSPDEQFLYTILQSPLANPDDAAYKKSRTVRILKLALNAGEISKVVGEYVYQIDTPDTFPLDNTTKQNDLKISELIALDTDKLIVLERITKQTKLYRIELANATNILNSQWDKIETTPSLEQTNLTTAAIQAVTKVNVFDSAKDLPDLAAKIESVALLDNQYVALINDNDFAIAGDKTAIRVVRLAEKLNSTPSTLPDLSNVVAVEKDGKAKTTQSRFTGGISVAGKAHSAHVKPELKQTFKVQGTIAVDPADVGKKAQLVVVVSYQDKNVLSPVFFSLTEQGQVQAWDGKLESLPAFKSNVTLSNTVDLTLFEGSLLQNGLFNLYFGYQLENGDLIFSSDALQLDANSDTSTENPSTGATSFRTNILHFNDNHSHLIEENYDLKIDGVTTRVKVGGIGRILQKINEVRGTLENPLVLHAGDAMQGTLYYTLFKGDADVEMLNLFNLDAMTYGNHEFDDGNTNLLRLSKMMNFPLVSANVDFSSSTTELAERVKPYIIKEIAGQKVGIFGLTTTETPNISSPAVGTVFSDEVESAKKVVAALEAQGVNKIVALTHIGYEKDIALAKAVAGIDVIVGGHSHTLLGDFSGLGLTSTGEYPTVANSSRSEPVCIVQAWQYNYVLGQLSVGFDSTGKVTDCAGKATLLIGDTFQRTNAQGTRENVSETVKTQILQSLAKLPAQIITANVTATEALQKYSTQVESKSKEVIGQATGDLLHIRLPGKHSSGVELPNGSLIAPLVSEGFLQQLNSRNYKADMVIQNAGGVRVDVLKGDISIGTAYTLLPFSNTIVVLELTGAEVKQVLEDAISNYADKGNSVASFPYGAGLRYTVTAKNAMNERVSNLEVRDEKGVYSAIDPSKTYKVGTNSFVAAGGDGYATFAQVAKARGFTDTFFDYAESFVNYVREVKTLNVPTETGVTYVP